MYALARMLWEDAADKNVTLFSRLKGFALRVFDDDGNKMPAKVKTLLDQTKDPHSKSRAMTKAKSTLAVEQQGTQASCDTCQVVLKPYVAVKSAAGFCDCCQRVVPDGEVIKPVKSRRPFVVSMCMACDLQHRLHGTSTVNQLTRPVPMTRIHSAWIQHADTVSKKLRAFISRSDRTAAPGSASSSTVATASVLVADTRLLAAEQDVEDWRAKMNHLKIRMKKTLRDKQNKTISIIRSHELYIESVACGQGMLDALKELIQVLMEIMRVRDLEIPRKLRGLVTKIRNDEDYEQGDGARLGEEGQLLLQQVTLVGKESKRAGGVNTKRQRSSSWSQERQWSARERSPRREQEEHKQSTDRRGHRSEESRDWQDENARRGQREQRQPQPQWAEDNRAGRHRHVGEYNERFPSKKVRRLDDHERHARDQRVKPEEYASGFFYDPFGSSG